MSRKLNLTRAKRRDNCSLRSERSNERYMAYSTQVLHELRLTHERIRMIATSAMADEHGTAH